jgi:hypothetical protein
MNCRQARALVSEARDQRLGQADSRAFRAHVLACQGCRRVFDDFRTLQIATRDLPRHAPTGDFQTELMRRIAAGEGTPIALLRGPVPVAHRVRLFVSGAATAAALLVAAWLLIDGLLGGQNPPQHKDLSAGQVPAMLPIGTPFPIDSASLANRLVSESVASFNGLQKEAPTWRTLPPALATQRLVAKSRDPYYGFQLMRSLSPRVIELDKSDKSLREAEDALENVMQLGRSDRRTREAVEQLIDLLCRVQLSEDFANNVRIRIVTEPVDLDDLLPMRLRQPADLSELWSVLLTMMGGARDAGGRNLTPSPGAEAQFFHLELPGGGGEFFFRGSRLLLMGDGKRGVRFMLQGR